MKNPAYPDTRYVTELVAPDVVNTMPEKTLRAVADHAVVPQNSIRGTRASSQSVLDSLAAAGIDYDQVVSGLESAGISTFSAAWSAAADSVTAALDAARSSSHSSR